MLLERKALRIRPPRSTWLSCRSCLDSGQSLKNGNGLSPMYQNPAGPNAALPDGPRLQLPSALARGDKCWDLEPHNILEG